MAELDPTQVLQLTDLGHVVPVATFNQHFNQAGCPAAEPKGGAA